MKYFQKNSTATISLKIWKLCWFASIAGWSEESEHQNFQNLQKTFLLTFTAKDKKKPNGQKARQQRSQFYRCAPLPSPPFSSHLIKPPTCHKGAHANKIGTVSWTNHVALINRSASHIPLDNEACPLCLYFRTFLAFPCNSLFYLRKASLEWDREVIKITSCTLADVWGR